MKPPTLIVFLIIFAMVAAPLGATIIVGEGTVSGFYTNDGAQYEHIISIQDHVVLDTRWDRPGFFFSTRVDPGPLNFKIHVVDTGVDYVLGESTHFLELTIHPTTGGGWVTMVNFEDLQIPVPVGARVRPEGEEPDGNDYQGPLVYQPAYYWDPVTPIPEPATFGLVGLGLALFGLARRRVQNSSSSVG